MGHLFSAARLRRSPSFQHLTGNADFYFNRGRNIPKEIIYPRDNKELWPFVFWHLGFFW